MNIVTRLAHALVLLSSCHVVHGIFHDGNISAPCDSPLFCYGQVLQDIQLARPFSDSKTFVDMPTRRPLADVLSAYDQLEKPLQNNTELSDFLTEYFTPAGSELLAIDPATLVTNATFLQNLNSSVNREFVQEIVDKWPELTRTYNASAGCDDCASSFIPVKRPFVIAGGRFREPYYWDSYWILQGLVRTGGSFLNISRNQVENFLDNIEEFGFVPNGARKYYLNRSQPPVLAQMVRVYVEHSGDISILDRALPLMIREHDFFQENRSVSVTVGDNTYTLQRYNVDNNQPRPESFREDWQQVNNATYYARSGDLIPARTLTDEEKASQYKNLASGAESGWDYSSRWLRDPQSAVADETFPLATLNIVNIVPVDLNSLLYWSESTIASLLGLIGNVTESRVWGEKARTRSEAINAVMWNETLGSYFDYNLTSGAQYTFIAQDADPLPIETEQAPSDDLQVFFNVAQLLPFVTGAAAPEIKSHPATVRRAFQRVSDYLDTRPGGISATNFRTTQQWDQINVWPPLMQLLMEGLLKTPATNGQQDPDWIWTQDLALRLGQRYLDSAYCTWRATGGETPSSPKVGGLSPSNDVGGLMFEKYAETALNEAGSGGEYEVVVGFGWSNGVLIWVVDTFRDKLQTPACASAQTVADLGSPPSASSVDTRSTGAFKGRRAIDKKGSAIYLDSWDARWVAPSVGGLA